MTRNFTGWHMTAIMLVFFGVIVAVNVLMATYAVQTFGGKVVDNSYVAGQRFNGWLREARAQQALGWQHRLERLADGRLAATLRVGDKPLASARVEALATHPVGRADDVALFFSAEGGGRYVSERPLPAGRWYVRLTVARPEGTLRIIEAVQ